MNSKPMTSAFLPVLNSPLRLACLLACAFWGVVSLAQAVPLLINLQGRLSDANGNPLTTPQQIEFRLYQGGNAFQADIGTLVYSELNTVTPGSDGTYTYLLGSGSPLNNTQMSAALFDTTQSLYLQMNINAQPVLPRLLIVTAPYSLESATVVDGAITTSKLSAGAVTTVQLADGSVTTVKIASAAVTTPQLADQSVATNNVKDGAITAAKLGPDVQGVTVPSGLIAIFTGDCPSGWTRFADLDNLFLVGGPTYGTTGGSSTHTHTISTDGAHTHTLGPSTANKWADSDGGTWYATPDHTHDVSVAGAHDHGGQTGPASNLPPFKSVVLCQKN